jgi:pimeloyl-ACP methyl ester carboxylesterase
MMQGGGGGNGLVAYPTGASHAGDQPALSRGFAVASTDTGHKAKTGAFDFSFMRDQQAYLDFAFLANAEVAGIAKQVIAHHYAKPAAYSYFVGCSTGGREGMILSQRYPTVFNGIVSGDPAMRTGLSNLAIGAMDTGGLQPGFTQRCIRQAADRQISDRRRPQTFHRCAPETMRKMVWPTA